MKMSKAIKLFSVFSLALLLSLTFVKVKAYDSIDSTGTTEWYITEEEETSQYGVYYSHMIGKPKSKGANGTEKNVNFIHQFRFEDCRNKLPLPFDFAIINDILLCFCAGSVSDGRYWYCNDRCQWFC